MMIKAVIPFLFTILAISVANAQSSGIEAKSNFDSLILKAYKEDQTIRQDLIKLMNKGDYPKDSLVMKMMALKKQDFQNQQLVFPLIDQYIAGSITISPDALNGAYYIIQHAEIDQQEKYRPFVEKLFKTKVINTVEYARFADRLLIKKNKAQVYLTQAYQNASVPGTYPYPLKANAKALSKELGLAEKFEKEQADFKNEYAPLFLKDDEVALFGHLLKKPQADDGSITNIAVIMDGKEVARTNNTGFFAFKIKRSSLGKELEFLKDGGSIRVPVSLSSEQDWQAVSVN